MNLQLSCTSDETITNFSCYKLTEDKTSILKFGLKQPTESKTQGKTCFYQLLNQSMELYRET